MSRKNFSLDRRARFFLEIQPTVVRASLEGFSLWSILVGFLCVDGEAIELARAASARGDPASTMVLSEARGLWLFLVIREGI